MCLCVSDLINADPDLTFCVVESHEENNNVNQAICSTSHKCECSPSSLRRTKLHMGNACQCPIPRDVSNDKVLHQWGCGILTKNGWHDVRTQARRGWSNAHQGALVKSMRRSSHDDKATLCPPHVINVVSRHMHDTIVLHIEVVYIILSYLKGTSRIGLWLKIYCDVD